MVNFNIEEQGNKGNLKPLLESKRKGKNIWVKQKASTDNCGNKGIQANNDPPYEDICVLYMYYNT